MSDPVTYRAVLPVERSTVQVIAGRLLQHRADLRTRRGRRALGVFAQAVLFCRWLIDATCIAQLAVDNDVSPKSACRYLGEVLDVPAGQAPGLRGALLAARVTGHAHVAIDGTLIHTDRCSVPGPTTRKTTKAAKAAKAAKAQASDVATGPGQKGPGRVDLGAPPACGGGWSGKHHAHGGNIQVVTAPDGWPLWTSPVRPGREHDTTCTRAHADPLPALDAFTDDDHTGLADLGYEGENHRLVCAIKAPPDGSSLDEATRASNRTHNATRAPAERSNALLKHFKALRHVTLSLTRIGTIMAAASSSSTSNTTTPHDKP